MNESEIKNVVDKMMKKFQKGGFIDCLREGGSIDKCKCGKTIKAQAGTSGLYTGPVREGKYRPRTNIHNVPEYWRDEEDAEFGMPMSGYTFPIKSKYSSVSKYDEAEHAVAEKPYGLLGIEHVYGDDVDKLFNSLEQKRKNWESDPYRLQNMLNEWGKKFTYFNPTKHQEGGSLEDGPVAGRIPRSSMFDAAKEFMPDVDKKFVRQAYRTAKKQGREMGNTGTYLRQDARDRVIDKFRNYADNSPVNTQTPINTPAPIPKLPVLDDNVVIENEPIVINDNLFTNLDSSLPTVGLMGSFNKAFRQARNRGLDKFYYSGPDKKAGWFTTELAKDKPASNVDLSTPNPTTQGGAIPTTGG